MKSRRSLRVVALTVILVLAAAACGSDDDADDSAVDSGGDATGLARVCPDPLVLQTDWFPEAEYGAVYNLIGDDYAVDVDNRSVRGSLISEGENTGIDFEVRTGGPAIGSAPVASYVYTDDSIHLAFANTDSQVLRFADAPLLSVVAPLEKNPQMVMWDPETYPDVDSIADLGAKGITVNTFAAEVWSEVFVAQGIWSADQVDPSYNGSPARFISDEGATAQQGFASAEPHNYENVFAEWSKPVAYELLHDAGFQIYSQTIAIRPDDKDDLDACLGELVPIIQGSVLSYADAPERANAIIVDAVARYGDFWVYDEAIAEFSVATQRELELIGNGPNSTLGDMEADRVQDIIDAMTEAGMDVTDLGVDDIFTNEYIDPSIGF